MKRTLDADKEEWDVIGTPLPLTAPALSRSNSLVSGFFSSQIAVSRRGSFCDSTCDGSAVAATTMSTATAGATSRKRKRSSFGSEKITPAAAAASPKQLPTFAMAVMPRSGKRVKVWIKISAGRGRPRGSTNKKPERQVPNHVVTTGKKKPPPSSDNTDNSSKNNNNNKGNGNKNGRSSNLHSTRNNSRVKVVLPPTDVMASLEHASTPLKKKQPPQTNSKKPATAKTGNPVAELSENSHSAALPTACRTTRNSMATLAFSPLKPSTRPSAKGRPVIESQKSCLLAAAVPSVSRTTRNSMTSLLPEHETVGTLAAKPASSPLKQSTRSSSKVLSSVSRTTRSRIISSLADATVGTFAVQHASSPVRQSPRALAKSQVAESQNSHTAAMPSSRTTRNSRASLSADEAGGAVAVKPAFPPSKQSTKARAVAVVESQNGQSATSIPATDRTTRNGMAALSVAAIDQSGRVQDSQLSSVPPPESFPVGSVVLVQARSVPGNKRWNNKPGGVAHVTRVQQQGVSMRYDVKYVLGGREKDIEAVFLSWHDNSNNTRPVSNREAGVAEKQPSSIIKQPDSQISSQVSPPVDNPQVEDSLLSLLPVVNGPESKVSASFPVGAAVVVQGRWCPGFKHKPGGVARVTRVQQCNDSILYDVKYVLGGNEKSVEESLLSWHSDNVERPVRSNEAVAGARVSTSEVQQLESQTVTASQKSTRPADDKSSSSLVKHSGHQSVHSDEDAIASGGENNSQPERTSSCREQPKRISTRALLDDGTRGRGTPRSKSVRTRSMDILTEVAPYPNKRRRVEGSYLSSQSSTRRARDPLELLMP
jgi:hypothetical protein